MLGEGIHWGGGGGVVITCLCGYVHAHAFICEVILEHDFSYTDLCFLHGYTLGKNIQARRHRMGWYSCDWHTNEILRLRKKQYAIFRANTNFFRPNFVINYDCHSLRKTIKFWKSGNILQEYCKACFRPTLVRV